MLPSGPGIFGGAGAQPSAQLVATSRPGYAVVAKWSREMKLPFGLRDGELRHISSVEGGLACLCACPCCGVRLVAKKGTKVVHHFSHDSIAECAGALQTALHLKAKEILARRKEIMLPSVLVRLSGANGHGKRALFPAKRLPLDEVRVEAGEPGFVPDLTVTSGGRSMFVEVRVTHAVDAVKLARMRKSGAAVLEIDLSKHEREFDSDALEAMLVGESDRKLWLYNPRAAEVEGWLAARAVTRPVARGRGFTSKVRRCPIQTGPADLVNDCFYCVYLWDVDGPDADGSYPSDVLCTGHIREHVDVLVAKTGV